MAAHERLRAQVHVAAITITDVCIHSAWLSCLVVLEYVIFAALALSGKPQYDTACETSKCDQYHSH